MWLEHLLSGAQVYATLVGKFELRGLVLLAFFKNTDAESETLE